MTKKRQQTKRSHFGSSQTTCPRLACESNADDQGDEFAMSPGFESVLLPWDFSVQPFLLLLLASDLPALRSVCREVRHNVDAHDLEIQKVTLLTKPREGQKIYSKSWQVTVPEKFRAHMMRAESIPAGWSSRRFYPPRAPRPPPAGGAMKAQLEAAEAAKQAQAASLTPKWGEDGYVPPGAPTKSS